MLNACSTSKPVSILITNRLNHLVEYSLDRSPLSWTSIAGTYPQIMVQLYDEKVTPRSLSRGASVSLDSDYKTFLRVQLRMIIIRFEHQLTSSFSPNISRVNAVHDQRLVYIDVWTTDVAKGKLPNDLCRTRLS